VSSITVFVIHTLVILLAVHICKYIFWVINSRRMRWAEHIGRMEKKRDVNRVLVGKPLGRPSRRWEDNINLDLQEVRCGGMAGNRDS
jgi:hypothetical protein